MRIVSLVPNGTEILFALGAGDEVVAVSHECDHPAAARQLPQLTGSALAPELSAGEVDRAVAAQVGAGESLYTLDEERLAALAPELVVTQQLCPVCAVSTAQVDGAVAPLARCPEVLSLDPRRLADVFVDIRTVGERCGRRDAAEELIRSLEERLEAVRRQAEERAAGGRPRPRALALEWLDPPFVAGHWVPEMIALAGGHDAMAAPGDPSRRCSWREIAAAEPDLILVMPCGFDRRGAADQLRTLDGNGDWEAMGAVAAGRVFPLDANGLFSRPGPRLVDGIERLAEIFAAVG